ncbi:hypothetical protein NEAUS03_0063 [Nematocida ausubeli]|nr:hypothetical protein NEAUS03_0063 [Nematocida ausubeli]
MGKKRESSKRSSRLDSTDSEMDDLPRRRHYHSSEKDSKQKKKDQTSSQATSSKGTKANKQKKESRAKPKKNIAKKIKSLLVKCAIFPYSLAKLIFKRKKKKVEKEETECTSDYIEKRVTFSDQIFVHTYTCQSSEKHKITLRSITKSLPPVNLEMANKIKGTSRETPLASKILQRLDKKVESLENVRNLLRKKAIFDEKRSKSKIINILGRYAHSESSENDTESPYKPPAKLPKESSRTKNKTKKKASSKLKKRQELEMSDDSMSSAASHAYDTIIRKSTPTTSL